VCPKILLIEHDPVAAQTIYTALFGADTGSFDLEWVKKLSVGLERLSKRGIDAVLVELSLPDSHGMETFDKLFAIAPDVPILILGGDFQEALAKQAVARGAQDYLLPAHLDSYSLPRALRNAIERKAVEDALYVERERALVTLNSIGDAVLCTDISGKVNYLNVVAEAMTGWQREEAIGKPLAEVFHIIDGVTRQGVRDPLEMAVTQNQTVGLATDCVLVRRDGLEFAVEDSAAPVHDRSGKVIGAVIVFHDVTGTRAMSQKMDHLAQHDVLTNLPNRLLLHDRITQAISAAQRQRAFLAVIFLDLDGFKHINDSLGHAVGDQVLKSISSRLVAAVRRTDTVSRQGGDEFVILLPEISAPHDAAASAKKILLSLSAPHRLDGQDLHINGSAGISIYPTDGEETETLIRNADTAMYHAKAQGRNNFQFYKAEMNLKAVQRQSLESSLHRALEGEEFLLHYQPKVNLETGVITGVEALLRWQHPRRGLLPPAQFVAIAEDCGLIRRIGSWVMREACKQARAWQVAGLPSVPVSVNVSAIEFRHEGFVAGVRTILSETGLQAHHLELELTESVLMDNAASTECVLQELKTMGVFLAVDDFGTGYSSLSYLRQFPINVLKIDQSFVQQITADPNDSTLVSAIINMGKSLRYRVIAEGIETQEQRAYLRTQNCAEGQGYLFSRPLTATQFASLLETGVGAATVHLPNAM
jgi:diguanylate cyclase (GGDEF)-like protein/PAS domain S-box-containing protein